MVANCMGRSFTQKAEHVRTSTRRGRINDLICFRMHDMHEIQIQKTSRVSDPDEEQNEGILNYSKLTMVQCLKLRTSLFPFFRELEHVNPSL